MRSFVEFMNEEFRDEQKRYWDEDYKTFSDNCSVSTLGLVWFTVAVKLAVESNSPESRWYGKINTWAVEVEAMLTAYYKTKYITAMEYCTFHDTFNHWMNCNYRAKKPFTLKRGL